MDRAMQGTAEQAAMSAGRAFYGTVLPSEPTRVDSLPPVSPGERFRSTAAAGAEAECLPRRSVPAPCEEFVRGRGRGKKGRRNEL